MPKVPTYDGFQATPNTLPQAGINLPDMPDVAGRQAREMGQGMMQAGSELGKIAQDMQQTADQLRIDDSLNQVKEQALRLRYDKDAGFNSLKGFDALNRPDGKPLAEEYGEKLKTHIDQVAASLGNDRQRQEFARHAAGILTGFKGEAIGHEASEFKTWGLSVSEGVQSTAMREIGLNWNNPEAVNSAVERIKAETYRQGKLLGKSAEWQEAQARKLTSNAHAVAITSALENNDPLFADAYMKRYSSQMDADDMLKVRGHITTAVDTRVGMTRANEVMSAMQPRIQPGEAERLENLVGAAGGVNNPGNMRVPGSKSFQSFPTLEAGFAAMEKQLTLYHDRDGLRTLNTMIAKWAPKGDGKNDPQAYARFVAGKVGLSPDDEVDVRNPALMKKITHAMATMEHGPDYLKKAAGTSLQEALQRFQGDAEKAVAAVSLGIPAVEDAVKRAEKSVRLAAGDPGLKPLSWKNFIPQETVRQADRTIEEFSAGKGAPTRPTFQEIDDRLRSDPTLTASPTRYKVARNEAERLFNEQTRAIKQREEETVAEAMRGILQNGGRYSELPLALRAAVPPKEVDNLIGFAQKIARGDDSTSLWLYNDLTAHPEKLAQLSDSQMFALRRELSEADFKHFSNLRAKQTGSDSGRNGPGDLNNQAIKQTLDARLRMLGTNPTPKDDGGAEAARIGGMRQFFDTYFLAAQREAGKKFTDAEIAQHVDALFATNVTVKGWFSDSSRPLLGMKAGDIDGATKDRIKASFKRKGVDSPTEAQILNAYWNLKVKRP